MAICAPAAFSSFNRCAYSSISAQGGDRGIHILMVSKRRPVIIQSLFPLVNGQEPPWAEIEEYAQRLKELKAAGAQIAMVQVYSAHRPPHRPNCEHLALKSLSRIAAHVRKVTGLRAEVF